MFAYKSTYVEQIFAMKVGVNLNAGHKNLHAL